MDFKEEIMKTQTVNLNDLFANQFQELAEQEMMTVSGGLSHAERVNLSNVLYYASAVAEPLAIQEKRLAIIATILLVNKK